MRLSDIQESLSNDAVRQLADSSIFLGITSYGPVPYSFQGTVSGYTSGGNPQSNVIDKFSFTVDANASDVGDLTVIQESSAGQSSSENGYTSGNSPVSVIDKFPFATDANASDVGDLTVARNYAAGQSSSTYGYTSGGSPSTNVIDKFSFSADGNASDVGDLTVARYGPAGQSSTTHGYSSGGVPPVSNVIDKFPFAADANASDVGDLTVGRYFNAGQSSETHGYTSGGSIISSPPATNVSDVIDKFSFASDGNASDVGDILFADLAGYPGKTGAAGQSSTTYGYISGGRGDFSNAAETSIQKFPFASNTNTSEVSDLTVARSYAAGQQY